MHGTAAHWQKRLRRELDDRNLVCRWNEMLERFEVGEVLHGLTDSVDWFYLVTDGDNGYRPMDMRTVRKVRSLCKRHNKVWKADEYTRAIVDAKKERSERQGEEIRYQLKEGARHLRRSRYTRKRGDA
jgi:hypothetical protein